MMDNNSNHERPGRPQTHGTIALKQAGQSLGRGTIDRRTTGGKALAVGDGYGERRCTTCEFFKPGKNGVGTCEQLLVNVEAKAHACELYELGAEEDDPETATG